MGPSVFSNKSSEISIFADENIDVSVVAGLNKIGIEAVSAREENALELGDDRLLKIATEKGRVFLTNDRKDFKRLGEITEGHAGIVIVSRRLGVGETIREILKIVDHMSPEDIAGTVQWIPWD